MVADFRNHRDELVTVLHRVQTEIEAARSLHALPKPILRLREAISDSQGTCTSLNLPIRKLHDFYGWMAKHDAVRGYCNGSLYRTVGFMSIERAHRFGKKPRKQPFGSSHREKNIHIEHTVPIAVIEKVLQAQSNLRDYREKHSVLLKYSICVAFSMEEESWCRKGSANIAVSKNDAFNSHGKLLHESPFRRYLPLVEFAKSQGRDFKIRNIVTETDVDLESFSFRDHEETLAMASEMVAESGPSLYSI